MGGTTDNGDDDEMWGRRGVGVYSVRGGDGIRGDPPQRIIHREAADKHSG